MAAHNNQGSISFRKFYLTIESAQNLPDVRLFGDTKAYAEVLLGSANKTIKSETKADNHNGLNPVWNHPFEFKIPETDMFYYGISLVIKLYAKRSLKNRYIGEVYTTIKDLYDEAAVDGGSGSAQRSFPIKIGHEETGGILNLRYSFGKETFKEEKNKFMEAAIEIFIDTVGAVVPAMVVAAVAL